MRGTLHLESAAGVPRLVVDIVLAGIDNIDVQNTWMHIRLLDDARNLRLNAVAVHNLAVAQFARRRRQ